MPGREGSGEHLLSLLALQGEIPDPCRSALISYLPARLLAFGFLPPYIHPMNPRELFLLSPYRLPTQNSVMLGNEDVAAFLNGYSALWHPASLRGASGPPRIASQYDHEQPAAGHVYAVPDSPPLFLPEDWDNRVLSAGAVAFRSSADRPSTFESLQEALKRAAARNPEANSGQEAGGPAHDPWKLTPAQVAPFLAIGFGYVQIEALFEAMSHDNVLAVADLWADVQQALAALDRDDADACRRHLQAAADRLLTARQVLYPVVIHLIDLLLLDEDNPADHLPPILPGGLPLNLMASGSVLEKLRSLPPERLAALREAVQAGQTEVCGGCYLEREDALLPLESQLWNLHRGLAVSREVLGTDVQVFARRRFDFHPQLPLLLTSVGLRRALLLAFNDGAMPTYRSTVVGWPSPDGKQVEAFARTPYPSDTPQTWFHLAHYLHETIMHDHVATVALLHTATPAAPWYHDWQELSRLAPVLGQWTTLTRYLTDVPTGEHVPPASPDEFHADYLQDRTIAHVKHPVTEFARQARTRRRIDTAWTLAALNRGLAGSNDSLSIDARLGELENRAECGQEVDQELAGIQKEAAQALAERLLVRGQADNPGYLVLNPCSFARRVSVELDEALGPLPIAGPLKACQVDGDRTRLVVEVPALGFAWVPRAGPPGTPPQALRMRLADERHVRNEFFEAAIDPATGGLRGVWDHRTRVSRVGQQIVYNPGSTMRATEIKVTSTGPALGEVVSEGAVLGAQQEVLATYRQRFRAWLGRPVLDVRIEIYPQHAPEGYPWHAYYGARFAWRDERALLMRGVNGTASITSHTRPVTPDYLDLRQGGQSTVLFPGGLPFHQRHGARMVDVILVPEGETGQTFDLAVGLDREHPVQTALGIITPVPGVLTTKGPPHVGATGWLFHLDAPNLLLTGLRPGPEGADAVIARLLECGQHGGQAELRCVRNPLKATLLDANGQGQGEAAIRDDAVILDVAQGDLVQVRIDFR